MTRQIWNFFFLWFSVFSHASLPGIPKFYVHALPHSSGSYSSSPLPSSTLSSSTCQNNGMECPVSASPTQLPNAAPVASIFKFRGGNSVLNNLPLWKDITRQMSPTTFKIFLQLLLTSLNVLCWAIPLTRGLFLNNDFLLGLANSFSAGIFLMLAFTQMIPHALDIFQNHQLDLSLAFKYSVVGYLVILSIEKILLDPSIWRSSEESQSRKDRSESEIERTTQRNSSTSGLILVLAMSIHSLFESIALGMSSDPSSSLLLASSIGLHQPAESLALLVSLLKSSLSKSSIIMALLSFSMIGPLGSFLGNLITSAKLPYLEGILVSMTAGTFLYAAATEIIPEELNENSTGRDRLLKFLSLLGGMGIIALLS